jgi:hypothetical protein
MGGTMSRLWETIGTVVAGIFAVAIIALLVSKKSNTSAIIQNAATGFASVLGVAESPVTGSGYQSNLSYFGDNPRGTGSVFGNPGSM